MSVGQALRTAIRNLRAHKGRFAQVMICIVVGVAGVTLTLCVSNSLLNLSKTEDEVYGSTLLMMDVMTNVEIAKQITPADMEQAARDNPEVIRAVSPVVRFELAGGVRYGDKIPEAAYVEGVGEQYIDMVPGLFLLEGRFLQPMDCAREQNVCVVGDYLARELLEGDAVGKTIKVWGENYAVVGVMGDGYQGDEGNCEVLIPYTNAKKMVDQRTTPYYPFDCTMYWDRYYLDATSTENMYEAQLAVEDMLARRIGMEKGAAWQLMAVAFMYLSESIDDAIKSLTLNCLFGAAIILLVGGFGIMNVMQAVVQERTKEIGIRKAYGATDRDIERQFRLETSIISLLGGLAGVALGLLGAYAACWWSVPISVARGVNYRPSLDYMDLPIVPILLALGLAVGVGVIFGTYPAQQAAKMEPVAAINSD